MKRPESLRLAALLRVSTTSQADEGYSLEDQRRDAPRWCERTGHTLVEIAEDAGVTGHRSDRPAVLRVLELLRAGQIDGVLLPCVDRLGRDARVIHAILGDIRDAGGRVYYMDMDLPDDPTGRLLEGTKANIAEFEAAMFRKRGMRGKSEKALSGRWPVALRLYGYRVVLNWEEQASPDMAGRSGEVLEQPEEAAQVRRLFADYDAGLSIYALAKRLRAEGVPAPRGGAWEYSSVRRMLEQRAYIGEMFYGKREYRLTYGRQPQQRQRHEADRPQTAWIPVPCPALIDRALWERVQARLRVSAEAQPGRPTTAYLLRGCIRCASCVGKRGAPRVWHGYRKDANPSHPGYEILRYRCPSCWVERDGKKLEALAWRKLKQAAGATEARAKARQLAEQSQQGANETRALLLKLQGELAALDEAEARTADLVDLGVSAHIIRARLAKLQAQRTAKQARAQLLAAELATARDPDEAERTAEAWAAELREALEAAEGDPEQRQVLFRRYVRVTCSKTRTSVEVLGLE